MIKKSYHEIVKEPGTEAMIAYMHYIHDWMEDKFHRVYDLPKDDSYLEIYNWLQIYVPLYKEMVRAERNIDMFMNMSELETAYM